MSNNIVNLEKRESRKAYEARKVKVNKLMLESVSFLQGEISRLEEVETLLENRVAKMSIKRAKNLLIDAALLSCNAVSDEFDETPSKDR